jgi:hypothetical protein
LGKNPVHPPHFLAKVKAGGSVRDWKRPFSESNQTAHAGREGAIHRLRRRHTQQQFLRDAVTFKNKTGILYRVLIIKYGNKDVKKNIANPP